MSKPETTQGPGWRTAMFGAVAKLKKGIAYSANHYCEPGKGAAFLTIKSVEKHGGYKPEGLKFYAGPITEHSLLSKGDLLIANTDLTRAGDIVGCPLVVPALPAPQVTFSMDLSKVCVDEKQIDKVLLRYLLETEHARRFMRDHSSGSTVLHLKTSAVPKLTLSFPCDLDEQRRIADLLSAVDGQTAISEQRIAKLRARRAGLMQSLALPAATSSDSVTLGEASLLVTSGSRGWARYYTEQGALFLRIGNLTREHPNLRFEDVVRVRVPPGGEGARTRLEEGDLLISITADLGIIGCVPSGIGEAYVNQHIALARIADSELDPRWVAHVLAGPYGFQQIARLNDGGAKAGLNLPTVRALRIAKPSLETQRRLAQLLDAADAEISAEQAAAEKLSLYKRGLLASLLAYPAVTHRECEL